MLSIVLECVILFVCNVTVVHIGPKNIMGEYVNMFEVEFVRPVLSLFAEV